MASAKPSQTNPGFTLEIRRTFLAPREKVFAAWAEREQLEQWMCKDAASHVVIHNVQEIRTGGRYLIEVRDPAKSETYWGQGVYLEVKPPEKIVFSWAWTKAEPDGSRTELHPDSPDTKVTVEFFARRKKRPTDFEREARVCLAWLCACHVCFSLRTVVSR